MYFYRDQMKLFPFGLFFIFILLTITVFAIKIDVAVAEIIDGKIITIFKPTVNGVFEIPIELDNIGSVNYIARIKLEIYNATKDLIFIGWTNEQSLKPGNIANYNLYFFPNSSGNFSGKLKAYYANEIKDYNNLSFEILSPSPQGSFELSNFRTYEDYIKVEIKSNKSLENVFVIPSQYSAGWIFEQVKLNKLGVARTIVRIPYKPTIFSEKSVTINVATKDGKYFSSKTFLMKKETELIYWIDSISDGVRFFFQNLLS